MTIDELKQNHSKIYYKFDFGERLLNAQTSISIEFAISILEDMDEHTQINDKIQELKQYLDE